MNGLGMDTMKNIYDYWKKQNDKPHASQEQIDAAKNMLKHIQSKSQSEVEKIPAKKVILPAGLVVAPSTGASASQIEKAKAMLNKVSSHDNNAVGKLLVDAKSAPAKPSPPAPAKSAPVVPAPAPTPQAPSVPKKAAAVVKHVVKTIKKAITPTPAADVTPTTTLTPTVILTPGGLTPTVTKKTNSGASSDSTNDSSSSGNAASNITDKITTKAG